MGKLLSGGILGPGSQIPLAHSPEPRFLLNRTLALPMGSETAAFHGITVRKGQAGGLKSSEDRDQKPKLSQSGQTPSSIETRKTVASRPGRGGCGGARVAAPGGVARASGAWLGRLSRAGTLRASSIGGLVGVATSRDAIQWAGRGGL